MLAGTRPMGAGRRSTAAMAGAMIAVSALALASQAQPAHAAGVIGEGFTIGEVLDESWGWFIVVGLGAVFAIVITAETKIEERYLGVSQTSEWFNTAGRVIKTGLTAAAIVSAWTWAATPAPVLDRGVPVRDKRPVLVRGRRVDTGAAVRHTGH